MIEVEIESKRGFAYGKDSLKEYFDLKYEVERSEVLNGCLIYTLKINGELNMNIDFNYLNIGNIYCKHGNEIKYTSINRLPSEGWEELIDCWSCHSNEFKEILKLKKKVRKNGMLIGNFYCIPDAEIMPKCCVKQRQLFFDEIKSRFTVNNFIFQFFEEYFLNKNIFVVTNNDGKKYSIKFFYKCILFKNKMKTVALKVGVRENYEDEIRNISKEINNDNKKDFINESFKMIIIEQIKKNMLLVEALSYKLSFITYDYI